MFFAPIERLLFPPPVPDGLNVALINGLGWHMRIYPNWHPTPIMVAAREDGLWRIEDGRHRVIAAMMAGRPTVLAEQSSNPDLIGGAQHG